MSRLKLVAGIFVVIVFWIFLWQGIKEKLETTTFTSFGLFGVFTFWRELRRLFRQKIVWAGIKPLVKSLAGAWVLILVLAGSLAGAWVLVLILVLIWSGAWASSLALDKAGANSLILILLLIWALASAWAGFFASSLVLVVSLILTGSLAGTFALMLASAWALAWSWTSAEVGALAGVSIGVGVGVGVGVGAWVRARRKQDLVKFLAVFAFPFFCWSPIVFCFSTLAFLQFLSWQYTVFAGLALIGVGTALWLRGQKLEKQARNPLKGILDRTKMLN